MTIDVRSPFGAILGACLIVIGVKLLFVRTISGAYGPLDFGPHHVVLGTAILLCGSILCLVSLRKK